MRNQNGHHRVVHKNTAFKVVLISVIAVVLLLVVAVLLFNSHATNTISDNIYVNSISVGGLNQDEAAKLVYERYTSDYVDESVKVAYGDDVFEANLLDVVAVDSNATAKAAIDRSNNLFERLFHKDKIVIPFELDKDTKPLFDALCTFALEIEEQTDMFVFSEDSSSVLVDATKVDSLMDISSTVSLVMQDVSNAKFEQIEAPVIDKTDKNFALELYSRLARPAKNASVGINDDESTYVVPEQYGILVDKDEFLRLYNENNGVFSIDIKMVAPEITAEDLDIEFYQDVLGSYTSAYDVGLVNRSKNLSLAARLVNGTIVMPGKRFSYNHTVGPRTYERGFLDATVYVAEGTEEGIGGGICQVSSTIYCAQLRADLKTVSRTNHSYTVVYVPLGQDATVVYGALDYVFENDTNYPIKILASANGGYLTVKIMGTKVDREKSVDIISVTNSTVAKGETTREDPTINKGETVVKQNGQNGAVVSTYKVYYKDGVEEKREFISKSVYKPMNKIILIGTKEEELPPELSEGELPQEPEVTDPENPDESGDLPEDEGIVDDEPDLLLPEEETDETTEDVQADLPAEEDEETFETSETGI